MRERRQRITAGWWRQAAESAIGAVPREGWITQPDAIAFIDPVAAWCAVDAAPSAVATDTRTAADTALDATTAAIASDTARSGTQTGVTRRTNAGHAVARHAARAKHAALTARSTTAVGA